MPSVLTQEDVTEKIKILQVISLILTILKSEAGPSPDSTR